MKRILIGIVFLLIVSPAYSEGLIDLYERIKIQASEEGSRNLEREARFESSAATQKQMLVDVDRAVANLENKKKALQAKFDGNEDRLAELTTLLDRRAGDLGELFGVFRQTADDTQTLLFDSVVTLEYPERRDEVAKLVGSKEVPTIAEMQTLWRLLSQEVAMSGEVTRFASTVIEPGGTSYEAEVTRVGLFNVIAGDKYLNYLAETNSLAELPRQPAGYIRDTAADLSSASNGGPVDFAIDPSRGALLGLLVQSPSLMERIRQGKEVGYAIIALGIIGMFMVLERLLRLTNLSTSIAKQTKNLDQVSDANPLGRLMLVYYENRHLEDLDVISRKLEQVLITEVSEVKKGLPTIKVLAAIAPLMGLLGTVTGMIGTFQAITLFGTGDPKLMAGGISQALITTVLGLCAAIPLLLSHSMLNSRATYLSKVIGEQAAGMIATKATELAEAQKKAA
jgi:biopolymer transport protein ExbB